MNLYQEQEQEQEQEQYPYYIYNNSINIIGLRNPKCIQYKENIMMIGSKLYLQEDNKLKYMLYSYQLNEELKLIVNTEKFINLNHIINDYDENINKSSWIRDMYKKDNTYFLLIEIKKNIDNSLFEFDFYLLKTDSFNEFELVKKYNLDNNYFLFKDYKNNLFTSFATRTSNIWGKYLFNFKINDIWIKPTFDKFVDYNTNDGHVLHNIDYNKNNKIYTIIFSIRDYDDNEENKFKYECYTANSYDLINYFSTEILKLDYSQLCNIKWLCYPYKFNYNKNEYIICNQDDYGKKTLPLIFNKYLIDNNIYTLMNNLNYDIKKSVITQSECNKLIEYIFNLKQKQKLVENKIQYFERSGISKLQNTPHCYNCYLFDWNNISITPEINRVFNILKDNYEKYTHKTVEDVGLYPQLIHYPENGGFIGIHYHPLSPQYIGQVLLLQNTKQCQNGFYLKHNNNLLDLSDEHKIGDLLIFKFNLLHGVSPTINVNENLLWKDTGEWYDTINKISFNPDINNISGRWVAVLTQL
jgi:hypothetical protein